MIDSRISHSAGDAPTTTIIEGLAAGAYRIEVSGLSPSSPISPVSSDVLVWG